MCAQSGEANESLEETLEPVVSAIESGVILYVGLSNCTVEQIVRAQAALPPGRLISVQNECESRADLYDSFAAPKLTFNHRKHFCSKSWVTCRQHVGPEA